MENRSNCNYCQGRLGKLFIAMQWHQKRVIIHTLIDLKQSIKIHTKASASQRFIHEPFAVTLLPCADNWVSGPVV